MYNIWCVSRDTGRDKTNESQLCEILFSGAFSSNIYTKDFFECPLKYAFYMYKKYNDLFLTNQKAGFIKKKLVENFDFMHKRVIKSQKFFMKMKIQ